MTTSETERKKIIASIAQTIVDTAREVSPDGIPGGFIYAPLMGALTYDQFCQIMAVLVSMGALEKRGHSYYAVLSHA